MAKVSITFETTKLTEPVTFSYTVDEIYADDMVAAVAASSHGQVAEQIMADTGQVDADGNPILGPAIQVREATFAEGLKMWANNNVRDTILGAVNEFRIKKAQALALSEVSVTTISSVDA